jgi:putative hemolysin
MREILFILALIGLNGVLAMSELAVVSARKVRLRQLAERGDPRARAALALVESPTRFLSTVQIGITLVGIFAGAFGEATIAGPLAAGIRGVPALAPWAEPISLAIVVAAITYLSLVFGELIPKRLAMLAPETVARFIARPMRAFSVAASPLVWLVSSSTDGILRLLRVRTGGESTVTEDDIKGLMQEGKESGVFEQAEQDIVRNVFRLGDRHVDDIMVPRTEIMWLDPADPPEKVRGEILGSPHSRFPVGSGDIDNVVGVVSAKDYLAAWEAASPPDLRKLAKPALVVPDSMTALDLLDEFRTHDMPMALIADEFGSIVGAVTADDVLQAIVGDLGQMAGVRDEPMAVRRDDGSWLLSGMMPADELRDTLALEMLPGETEGHFRTLAGFTVFRLGHIPRVGEHFEFEGLRFEVVDMDANRVDKLLVQRAAG